MFYTELLLTISIETFCHVRFSLLLLEFGEVYFEDFTVVFYPHVKQDDIEERYILK